MHHESFSVYKKKSQPNRRSVMVLEPRYCSFITRSIAACLIKIIISNIEIILLYCVDRLHFSRGEDLNVITEKVCFSCTFGDVSPHGCSLYF